MTKDSQEWDDIGQPRAEGEKCCWRGECFIGVYMPMADGGVEVASALKCCSALAPLKALQ